MYFKSESDVATADNAPKSGLKREWKIPGRETYSRPCSYLTVNVNTLRSQLETRETDNVNVV